jgi:sugar lactone lactonase YvrE
VRRALAVVAALVVALPLTGSGPATGAAREKYDTRVFSHVPRPGFPAYVHVHTTNGRVYAGTYTNPAGDTQRSRVLEWGPGGALLRSWTVPGQDLSQDHGVQVATNDAAGRLVLLEKSTRRIMRLNVKTGRFSSYSRLPSGSIPNYAAWGPGGALFVTDYAQGTIWRVPPGGGTARAWFSDERLVGAVEFGTTGIVMGPARRSFYITQQTTSAPGADPTVGYLFRLGLRDDGKPGALRTLWTSQPTELPDGFGIGRSGKFYISLAGLTNQLVVVGPKGAELARIGTAGTGDNGSPIPFDTPSSATFLGKRVLVANQSFTGDTTHHAILDVYVGETGFKTFVPRSAGVR